MTVRLSSVAMMAAAMLARRRTRRVAPCALSPLHIHARQPGHNLIFATLLHHSSL